MNDRKYLIIPVSEIKKIDFSQIHENAPGTLAFSGDGKRTFIKWSGANPTFLDKIKKSEGPYNHEEILKIIRSDDWK